MPPFKGRVARHCQDPRPLDEATPPDPVVPVYLPEARSKPHRMTRLLDLDLFRRLRKRADADARAGVGDSVGAQRDLLSALMLVRGPVMAETPGTPTPGS